MRINVEGIVQGVGFRPFIYRMALKENLSGWVRNTTEGVEIEAEGGLERLKHFCGLIKEEVPPLARIKKITSKNIPVKGDYNFDIKESKKTRDKIAMISPDVAICNDCIKDITDPDNRRYMYPFTNCTNCGPRFSLIKELPYDRPRTTMKDFNMCHVCEREYSDPLDRRYHAQPNACSECGPQIWLTDNRGNICSSDNQLNTAVELLRQGEIIAVKGLSGFHLMCDAENRQVISRLRRRKERPDKPLALMMDNLNTVSQYCHFDKQEKDILTGYRKPILLLDKKGEELPENVAPGSKYYGVMLPYTPLHYLIFNSELKALVATSANITGSPIEYKNRSGFNKLKKIADYFLFHNRKVYLPLDDSVVRVIRGQERVIRRARGYVPEPVQVTGIEDGLALGAEQKNTICINRDDFAFLSQHLGNLSNGAVYDNYKFTIKHFKDLYQFKPAFVTHDLHPDYQSTHHADFMISNNCEEDIKKLEVQHHHAHIASCMVENNIDEKVIGLAFDGTGMGTDGNMWGGEFLLCDLKNSNRVGHLNYIRMPGGDKAVREPWRMAVSYLNRLNYDKKVMINILDVNKEELEIVLEMLEKDLNCVKTSSIGRLFDTVAALIGLRRVITYQAQAAVELEAAAGDNKETYNYEIKKQGDKFVINTDTVIKSIYNDYKNKVNRSIISAKFHNTVIGFSLTMCKLLRNTYGIDRVVLSGGVFQNEILFKGISRNLTEFNFSVYTHAEIPCNDGGISLGQLIIAGRRERRNR